MTHLASRADSQGWRGATDRRAAAVVASSTALPGSRLPRALALAKPRTHVAGQAPTVLWVRAFVHWPPAPSRGPTNGVAKTSAIGTVCSRRSPHVVRSEGSSTPGGRYFQQQSCCRRVEVRHRATARSRTDQLPRPPSRCRSPAESAGPTRPASARRVSAGWASDKRCSWMRPSCKQRRNRLNGVGPLQPLSNRAWRTWSRSNLQAAKNADRGCLQRMKYPRIGARRAPEPFGDRTPIGHPSAGV